MTGYLLINKPKDMTSFQCVAHVKRLLKEKIKIGHAGTLDPFATGLLIICVGRETTRSIDTLLNLDKEYLVKAKLGELADTLDHTGKVLETQEVNVTQDDLAKAIESMGTSYVQTPPLYSALKHQGMPLYKLAREKRLSDEELEEIIKKKSRLVELHTLDLLDYDPPYFAFRAHVSKGTYIRSLANDIAQRAGSCATTYELERTKIGTIPLAKAIPLATLTSKDDVCSNLLTKEQLSEREEL